MVCCHGSLLTNCASKRSELNAHQLLFKPKLPKDGCGGAVTTGMRRPLLIGRLGESLDASAAPVVVSFVVLMPRCKRSDTRCAAYQNIGSSRTITTGAGNKYFSINRIP